MTPEELSVFDAATALSDYRRLYPTRLHDENEVEELIKKIDVAVGEWHTAMLLASVDRMRERWPGLMDKLAVAHFCPDPAFCSFGGEGCS
jgi:hypothetical protein